MKIKDDRVHETQTLALGDIVRGMSGTYYMIIRINAVSEYRYGLLDLQTTGVRFCGNEIEECVKILERDENKTLIKSENVEVTFK